MANQSRLLLVDGMGLLFKGFYATAPSGQFMYNEQGIPTNAVQGFLRQLLIALQTVKPTHMAVCWDMGGETFRHRLFAGYKANRAVPPPEMRPQFDLAKEMVTALGTPNIGKSGFEADDCIGTLAQTADSETVIITGDRDLLQLLGRRVHVALLQKGYGNYRHFSEALFREQFGVSPRQFVEVKALMGDASDGYAGVRGIGEKTAFKLIRQYGSVHEVLNHLDRLPAGLQKKIATDREMLLLSRKLAEINCQIPVSLDSRQACFQGISDAFVEKADQLGMRHVTSDWVALKWKQADSSLIINEADLPF